MDVHAHLEGGLGIDSVLLQSILADIGTAFQLPSGSLKPHAFRTLSEVIAEVASRVGEGPGSGARAVASTGQVAAPDREGGRAPRPEVPATTRQAILEILRFHTGRSAADLEFDSHLQEDLGVSSHMAQAIVADLASSLGLPADALARLEIATVGDLIESVLVAAASSGAAASRDTAPPRSSTAPPRPPNGAPPPRPPNVAPPRPPNGAPPTRPTLAPERPTGPAHEPASTNVLDILRRVVGEDLAGASVRESFGAAGLSEVAQERVRSELARGLDLPATIRLDECDTVDKLERYAAAASTHAVRRLSAQETNGASAPADEDELDGWDGRTMKDFLEERGPDLFAKVRSFRTFYRAKRRRNLYWYGMPLEGPCRNRAVLYDEVAGRRREFLMFASNNYLGLASHPRVIEAIQSAAGRYGATNTGCRLIGGTNVLHKELERRLARFKGTEACIVYPSGYSANLGAISALVKHHDAVVVDKFNHMSIMDGCRLAGGQRRIFAHNDMGDLERVLANCRSRADGILIAVDGVFSMHGDVCDLPEIVRLARAYGAKVLVDDAHATGVLGRRGSGTAEHFGLRGGTDVDLELGTMSKTLAGVGGFVCGNEDVIEYLRFYSNSYVFAATIPAAVAAGLIASIDVMESEPERLATLWDNIRFLKDRLDAVGFDTGGTASAIVPIVIGDDRRALEMGRAVRARGLYCQTVVFPGVSVGDARLRISVTSEHTREDLERACDILIDAGRELGVLPPRADAV
ncbi:MAG: aminotransferase class I/II-fold pyridoxal phosphate-dependent enzyme [Kofleriaceae bacterium]